MSTAPEPSLSRLRPTVAEIDLDAFDRNIDAVNKRLPTGSKLIVVVKADGYGHGAIELARRCAPDRVAMIAVALVEEGVELREAGVQLPILVLGAATREQLPLTREHRLTLGIVSPEGLRDVADFAREASAPVPIHLKLDSGMNRMGLAPADMATVSRTMAKARNLVVEALYTHYANASDPDEPFTRMQSMIFEEMVGALRASGVTAPLHHRANSGAVMTGAVVPGDYVRVGISLYGGEALDRGVSKLEPVMRWKTRIARLKEIAEGGTVGYGMTFRATQRSQIATLPVGYADGYDRLLSNNADVLVRGIRVPVVGRVSMDLVTIDVTGVPEAAVGDEVVLLGSQGGETITAEELATRTKTISYEVFCRVSARVPRLYLSGGVPVALRSRFV